jgi:hypothetical protein
LAWIIIGHKHITEAMELYKSTIGRGAFQYSVEGVRTTYSGAAGKANVGISNDKEGEKPSRRKTKVS